MNTRSSPRLLVLFVMAAVVITAASAAFLAEPRVEGAGPYNVGNSAVRIDIAQQGPCQPGAIESGYSVPDTALPNSANPLLVRFTAPVNDNPGFRGCIAPANGPQYLVIDNELFQYANIHTQTASGMYVDASTQSFNLFVDNCYGYAPSDLIYVGMERMQWDTGFCDGPGGGQDYLHINARPDTVDTAHGPHSFVRVHGLLYLVGRGGLPKFLDFTGNPAALTPPLLSDPIAYTPAATHNAGATAHSPATYARCIDWLTQTSQPGDDTLSARTRCALIYEPGYNAASCDSTPSACYWPVSPPTDPAVVRRPVFHLYQSWNMTGTSTTPAYDELLGFIDDDGTGDVVFNYLPVSATGNCMHFFSLADTDQLFLSSDMFIPAVKNFTPGATGTGTMTVRYFVVPPGHPDPCGGGTYALTIPSSLSFEKLSTTADTDGDKCEDVKEMNGSINGTTVSGQLAGGWRDPLNHFDYFNPTGDSLNRVDDILKVVGQYFDDDGDSSPGVYPFAAGYDPETDRAAMKPMVWSLGRPNGQQRVDDILAVVKQYFHDC